MVSNREESRPGGTNDMGSFRIYLHVSSRDVDGGYMYVLQTAEIGTFPPPLSSSMIRPLLSFLPEEPREGEEEAA